MGNGTKFKANGYTISTSEKRNVVLEQKGGDLYLHNKVPVNISINNKKKKKFEVGELRKVKLN